ncbi:GNAT family N-acetyltransferase [Kribbella sp. NPDC051587]|uniref:GNAT family N-acetyltransferase n=1 Tax=Kribbella sp. NPDC051587 TaxID=3364119 RepID=UPI003791DACE
MLLSEYGVTVEQLGVDHADALLAFELENRRYFAAAIADRGDEFFATFADGLRARLAEQATGECRFHVLVEADGAIVGRVNLVDLEDGSAELGYRIAERAAGRGLATAAVRAVTQLAVKEYGLRRLTAGTAQANVASRTVLERAGFKLVAETPGVRPQAAYELSLEGL